MKSRATFVLLRMRTKKGRISQPLLRLPFVQKTLRVQGQSPLRFTLYPTGEFSATRVRETASLVPSNYAEGYEAASAYLARSCDCPGRPTNDFVNQQTSPLGLSNVSNSHKPRKARGRKGMSSYNKRLVVNGCILLERKYGKKHLSFITLTLPPECESGESELYIESKRQMLQWLQRRLAASFLPSQIIGCTELQGSRFSNTGAFALHEHWVCVGRKPYSSWSITPKALQSAWLRILSNVYQVGISEGHSNAACRIESIVKSTSAYLGKYMGKSEAVTNRAIEAGLEHCLPSSWVTRSLSMLKMFRLSILKVISDDVSILIEVLKKHPNVLTRWNRDISILSEQNFNIWIAWIGYLTPLGRQFIFQHLPKDPLTDVLHYG